jgi:hypothetical protein
MYFVLFYTLCAFSLFFTRDHLIITLWAVSMKINMNWIELPIYLKKL